MTMTREDELSDVLKQNAPWSLIDFLDTLNSVSELEALAPILAREGQEKWVRYYRDLLTTYPDPQLPEGFREKCPLLAERLDTPQKVRILLRGAKFRDVSPLLMGEVLEDIIRQHEVEGKACVKYPNHYTAGDTCKALRIVYHTQLQARTLCKLALPGHTRAGGYCSPTESFLFIDWGTEE
jgi:hypothetical protein